MRARRYQLRKEAVGLALHHPWIFRDHMSSAASVFRDGEWLRLVDGHNQVVGHGIYEESGAIAIRMLRRGPAAPDAAWLRGRLAAAVARRAELASPTNDALARYAARALDPTSPVVGPARHVVLRPAHLRRAPAELVRILRGAPPEVVHFVENGLTLAVDIASGQKTGTYLDLRGLRREIAAAPLQGARVLNLFAYTGTLGSAAAAAGAATIVQVDASEHALAFAAAHHASSASHAPATSPPTSHSGSASYRFVVADVFEWLPGFTDEPFDLVIVDPPAMTTRAAQLPSVLAAYRKLYRAAARLVRPGGSLVAACCTGRIERAVFHRVVREALGDRFTLQREIAPEPDHPIGFPQADYLKIGWWMLTA